MKLEAEWRTHEEASGMTADCNLETEIASLVTCMPIFGREREAPSGERDGWQMSGEGRHPRCETASGWKEREREMRDGEWRVRARNA